MHCTRASLLRIEVAKQTYLGLQLLGALVILAVKLVDRMPAFYLVIASSK